MYLLDLGNTFSVSGWSHHFCLLQCRLDLYQLHMSENLHLLSADEVFCFMKGFDGVLMPLMIYSTVIVAMYWGFPQIKKE